MLGAIDFEGGLENAWDSIITWVPKLLGFLLILGIGYFVAKAIEKVIDGILERVGFDRLVERGGLRTALSRSKLDASSILARIVFYVVFLFVLQLAFGIFGANPISDLIQGIIAFLPKVFVAILIVVITAAVATATKTLVESLLGGLSYGRTLAVIASAAIWFVGIAAALNQIEVAPLIVNGLFYAVLALVVGAQPSTDHLGVDRDDVGRGRDDLDVEVLDDEPQRLRGVGGEGLGRRLRGARQATDTEHQADDQEHHDHRGRDRDEGPRERRARVAQVVDLGLDRVEAAHADPSGPATSGSERTSGVGTFARRDDFSGFTGFSVFSTAATETGTTSGAPMRAASAVSSSGILWLSSSASTRFR